MKEVELHENHWLFRFWPLKDYNAITLGHNIYSKGEITKAEMHHELVHVRQIEENGWVKFYFLYLIYYIRELFKNRFRTDLAYVSNPFEREAYDAQFEYERQHSEEWVFNDGWKST